ncbi:ketosynthase chain-length factor [Nonomuraea aridisoli]|uniref:Ketosynthase chain-length factor n=1 Tax=Nonomuraea aridisoli TaxID=2070368 RepID=A0A2W2EPR7_9ACTN|nr:ketosynthase chain-length factor [Nonomuraea aridisoli]PZG18739.1 ketosynthase chain-length factor [Nonomuraea aridisoli]
MSRAVVTGVGIAAPTGLGTAAYWAATVKGENGIGPITRFDASGYPARLAGEVPGFDPLDHLPSRLIPQTDRLTQLALVAADWSLADAGVQPKTLPEFGMGVITASSSGGFEFGQRELEKLWGKGPEHVSAYQSFAWFYAVNTGQISIRHGMRGPSGVLVTEQAGGLDAVAQARRQIRRGVGLLVTGGADASLCPWGWVAQLARGQVSTRTDPDRSYLPFDAEASGYVPGEGAALLVLEEAESARRNGRRVYGEIAGYGATFDPRPGSGRPPGLRRAMEIALADAEMAPADIDVIFADGAGLPEPDRQEAEAIQAVFTAPVPVTVPKAATGRLYSGGSALDLATALLSLAEGVIPPTPNVTDPVCDLELVTGRARTAPLRAALVLARGHGGFNSAMVVRAP